MIHGQSITHHLGGRIVVDNVTITIPDNGTLGLVGPNGSGKTTLLRCLYRSISPTAGTVHVDGTPITDLSRREVAHRLAVVVQERPSDLPMAVCDLVLLGRLPHQRWATRPTAADLTAVDAALEQVGVTHLADRDYSTLSGGEQQRVLIARALAQDATHILLDEPTNHLDIRHQHDVLSLVSSVPGGTAVVLHDLNLAARYCDQIVVLDGGRVVAAGTPDQVLVPEVLEPVYGVEVRRLDVDGHVHLMFGAPSFQPVSGLCPVRLRFGQW